MKRGANNSDYKENNVLKKIQHTHKRKHFKFKQFPLDTFGQLDNVCVVGFHHRPLISNIT